MKVALIIGHNKRAKGAYSQILGREYDYWKRIAEKIKENQTNITQEKCLKF